MADIQTSYNGVSFTEEQKSILTKDLNSIDELEVQLKSHQDTYNEIELKVNVIISGLEDCKKMPLNQYPSPSLNAQLEQKRNQCITTFNSRWDSLRGVQASVTSKINSTLQQIELAKKNYNDDLESIQNQIKFQIQANISNTANDTQAAQNQVTLNQNDPRLLLVKAQTESAAKLKALELQATLDKQKREAEGKMVGFILIAVAVIGLGYLAFKRWF